KLSTPDNLDVIVPNNDILTSKVINYSAMPLRRLDLTVPVSYSTDVESIKALLSECLQDERIVSLPAPMCRVSEYGNNALKYLVRCWVPNGLYWDVRFDLNERIFTHLKNNGVEIPFNQLDVHVISEQNTNGEEA
ncbi:MAG: mechanosensitive ion channel family protein, partial [Clostridia bacterium]|nr:mechanosensitive ion channel family protein [Clostridia bacterium]